MDNSLAGQYHNGSEGYTKDGILPKVQEGEASGGLEGTFFILAQDTVISLCLILLVVEILHNKCTNILIVSLLNK